jgi:chaperonin GroES
MALTPANDRILVKPQEVKTRTESGFYIPDSAQEKLPRGTVFKVGKGRRLDDGTFATPEVKEGDVVIYTESGPQKITVGNQDYIVMKEEDILCIVDEE